MKITDNSQVTIDYTMTLENGEVIDSTKDLKPLTYTQGTGEIMAGLESRIQGKKQGDTIEVTVPAAEGFGDVDPEAFIEIPKTDIPPENLEVGTILEGQGPQGQSIEGTVVELKEKTVIVDFNHPLAGKMLNFSITIVDVQ